jgi:hypothetical protein
MLTFVAHKLWATADYLGLVYVGKWIHNRHINAQITTMLERTKQYISCLSPYHLEANSEVLVALKGLPVDPKNKGSPEEHCDETLARTR